MQCARGEVYHPESTENGNQGFGLRSHSGWLCYFFAASRSVTKYGTGSRPRAFSTVPPAVKV